MPAFALGATQPSCARSHAARTPRSLKALDRYVETGVEELDDSRLPDLIKLKYPGLQEGIEVLGGADQARQVFIDFQRHLYMAG